MSMHGEGRDGFGPAPETRVTEWVYLTPPPAIVTDRGEIPQIGFAWREHIPTHADGGPYAVTRRLHGELAGLDDPDGVRVLDPDAYQAFLAGGDVLGEAMLDTARRDVERALDGEATDVPMNQVEPGEQ